jgi:Asp-tRNA(Asn)/Glu-tRNA(Gln) amidotransferase A subunit family amidase
VIAGSSLTVSADRFDAWVCGDRQLMAARPDTLSGLPIGVKDVIATRDYPTRCGTDLPQEVIQVLLEKGEADCISDLKQAGAIVAGKTVTAELATYQPGNTVNPLSVTRSPGGSSSGSAAAVTAGDVRLALATQTAGSTIRPASYCGLYGFKPSYDRYALAGVLATSPTLDTLGLIADELGLIQAADRALTAQAPLSGETEAPLPRRLVLYRTSNWAVLPAEHQKQIEKLAQRLAMGFAEYREQDALPDLEALTGHQRTVHAGELASVLGWLAIQHGELVSDTFKQFVAEGEGYAGVVLEAAVRAIQIARDRANEYVRPDEVWLTPSVTSVAPPIEAGTGDPLFCRQWTALGVPCLSVPLLYESVTGLPYGPQLVMSRGEDRRLLEVAGAMMKLIGEGG